MLNITIRRKIRNSEIIIIIIIINSEIRKRTRVKAVENQRKQVEIGRSLDKEERQQMNNEAHRMATSIWKKMQGQTET